MNYLVISIVSVLIFAFFLFILLANSKTSNNFSLKARILTVWHPLKRDVIDLEKDLKSWNISRMNLLWTGKLYALTLKLKDGAWKKIYFRSRSRKMRQLVGVLEDLAPEGRI